MLCLGDSRVAGFGDKVDGLGALGNTARSMAPHFAYLALGEAGEQAVGFVGTNGALRRAFLPYFSHVACNYGFNDVNTGRSQVQIVADIATIAGQMAEKPVFWLTMEPYTTSTDNWATVANQTKALAGGTEDIRVSVNELLRTGGIAGIAGIFDTAAAAESDLDSGLWKVAAGGAGGAGLPITDDGIPNNPRGYQALAVMRVVDAGRLRRL